MSKQRRGSKTSITSSWSSLFKVKIIHKKYFYMLKYFCLFKVVSTEDISSEAQYQDTGGHKARSRKEPKM